MYKEIYKPGTKVYLDHDVVYFTLAGETVDRSRRNFLCTVTSDRVRQSHSLNAMGEGYTRDYIIVARGMELFKVYIDGRKDLRLTADQRMCTCKPGDRVMLTSDAVKWDSRLKDLAGEELVVGSYVYYDEEEKKACVNVVWRCGMAKVTMHVVGPLDCFKRIEDR